MAEELVLTVIEDDELINIGTPETFDSELLVEYCKRGCKIETFTIDEFRLSGWKLYEQVKSEKDKEIERLNGRVKELEDLLSIERRNNRRWDGPPF